MSKYQPVPLKNLNLTSRFLFDAVMEDPATHRDVLEIALGREIPPLTRTESEKEFRRSPEARAIRMDIFAEDEEKVVYDTEMQSRRVGDMARRSRYYQAMMDTTLLEPGSPDYNELNTSYIVIILTFDLFGLGLYRYTFRPVCREAPECTLEDGATRIFLCTKGRNEAEVTPELVQFLRYIEHTTDEEAQKVTSERLKRIHERVRKVKASEEMGVRYMRAWEELSLERAEARQEGREEGIKEGIKEGRLEQKRKFVTRMRDRGLSVEEISDLLLMEPAEVEEILDEMSIASR